MGSEEEGRGQSRLTTVIIFTQHMEELAHFYQAGLGIGPYQRSPQHLGCQVGPVYFGFDQVEQLEGHPPSRVTLWFAVEDLQATFDRLMALGAKVSYPPTRKPWGADLAAVYDLDGNLLGLAQQA